MTEPLQQAVQTEQTTQRLLSQMAQRIQELERRLAQLERVPKPGNFAEGAIPIGKTNGRLGQSTSLTWAVDEGIRNNGMQLRGAGASFPGSVTTGDLFFREDLGDLFYWNGLRWLSVTEYHVQLYVDQTASFAASTNSFAFTLMESSHKPYFTRAEFRPVLGAPNDINDYWTLRLRHNGVVLEVSTQGDPSGVQGYSANAGDFTQPGGGFQFIAHDVLRTGSPGAIRPRTMSVYYRISS